MEGFPESAENEESGGGGCLRVTDSGEGYVALAANFCQTVRHMNIAINGFGRIGRQALRIILEKHPELKVVLINDLTDGENGKSLSRRSQIS